MEWQPIETAPADLYRSVLVFAPGAELLPGLKEEPDKIHAAYRKRPDGAYRLQDNDHIIIQPTHWMPLPEPPQLHYETQGVSEFLPCPFCGKQPFVEQTGFHLGGRTIRCETPDCMGPHTTAACIDDAVFQWNRRAPR